MVRALTAHRHLHAQAKAKLTLTHLPAGMKALAFQKEILEGRVVVPNEEAVPTFMREDGSGVETSLCKETYMSDEEKQAMKDKATAKMMEVRYRK
jgi:hypothetical protein